MYDTIRIALTCEEAGGIDFLHEVPPRLENIGEHDYDGRYVVTGNIEDLRVSVSEDVFKIDDFSLCKLFFGNNFYTLNCNDTRRAVEWLADYLYLPIERGRVSRIDFASNIETDSPPAFYFRRLGGLRYYKRLEEPNGLYYTRPDRRICIYDKAKEAKAKRDSIPPEYMDTNVLRYEQRYMGRVCKALKGGGVFVGDLYNPDFYNALLQRWRDSFAEIKKIRQETGNDNLCNIRAMKTVREAMAAAYRNEIERTGGLMSYLADIEEQRKSGYLTRKQAHDLRQAAKNSYQIISGADSGYIIDGLTDELGRKIEETATRYRAT